MKSKKIVILGFMVAVAVVLQVFESMIPFSMPVPGGKLGLANIVTFVVMVVFGGKAAVLVAVIRAVLGSLLYGGAVYGIYSVTAALGASFLSVLLYKYCSKFSLLGIGVASALCHNFLQVTVASVLLGNVAVFTYYPVLMLVSIPSGALTGLVSGFILKNNVLYRNLK